MIQPGYRQNFHTLIKAIRADDVALLDCTDKATGQPAILICAVNRLPDETIQFAPLARMLDGNPFEDFLPPSP